MADLISGLSQLGVEAVCQKKAGYAPIVFTGRLQPGRVAVEGYDSQTVSALLIAMSYLEDESTLLVTAPGEVPWVDMTVHWLAPYVYVDRAHDVHRYVVQGSRTHPSIDYSVPGDFSSVSYWVAAACIAGFPLEITGLDWQDVQGDKVFIQMLQQYDTRGVITYTASGVVVRGVAKWQFPAKIDINTCVDMVTILAVAVLCN